MGLNVLRAVARNTPLFVGDSVPHAASADATTDIAEFTVCVNRNDEANAVSALVFTPEVGSSTVNAHNSNYWTITFTRYAGSGSGSGAVVGSVTTKAAGTNGLAAHKTVSVPVATDTLAPGDVITAQAVHSGTPNAAFPAGVWAVGTAA